MAPGGAFDPTGVQGGLHPGSNMAGPNGSAMNNVIKSKLAIDPIAPEEISKMNKEYLEPLINNSEVLYIL